MMSGTVRLLSVVVYTLLALYSSALAVGCDKYTAGYSPFSGQLDNGTVIGLLFTVGNEVYTSRCLAKHENCEDGRLLYSHNFNIKDLDVYYDGCGVYITDINSQVFWMDISSDSPPAVHLNSPYLVAELSVDWLTPHLYIITTSQKMYRCDMDMDSCVHLHDDYLSYTPSSLVADPFNGYLYWITNNGSLIKHDLAKELLKSVDTADIAITSNVSTYSVAYNCYDLYAIYNYDVNYSEITLTYLNGQNERTHIVLNHTAGDVYSELNCFHNTVCLWLKASDNHTSLQWTRYNSKQPLSFTNLNVTGSSLLRAWHRQVQPLPAPTSRPEFTEYYTSSTRLKVSWAKPDIVGDFIKQSKWLSVWQGTPAEHSKFMQSDAAWAAWLYELNVTSINKQHILTNLSELSTYVDGLEPSTTYNLSILAYTETERGPTEVTVLQTTPSDPVIYTSSAHSLRAIDALGDERQAWNMSALPWTACEMVWRDSNSLYVISYPGTVSWCNDKSGTNLHVLDTAAAEIAVVDELRHVSALTYDWIGKMVYLVRTADSTLYRADAFKSPMSSNLERLVSFKSIVRQLSIDSVNGKLYWTSARDNDLYSLDIGPAGSYVFRSPLHDGQIYNFLNGPVVDMTSNSVYWVMVGPSGSGYTVMSCDLFNLTEMSAKSAVDLSSEPFQVANGKMYMIFDDGLRTIDMSLKRIYNTLDAEATSFLFYSPESYPLLAGMNDTTDTPSYVLPVVDSNSFVVVGKHDNFSIQWYLTSPEPLPTVEVLYNVSVSAPDKRIEIYKSSTQNESSTPYFTGVAPETKMNITIQPYTKWRTGNAESTTLVSPGSVPGAPENIRMMIRRNITLRYLVIKWNQPSFTGGSIVGYNISLVSEADEKLIHVGLSHSLVEEVVVSNNVLYNVSMCAQTSAGYGNWSPVQQYNTSKVAALPVLNAIPYTPTSIEVKWKLSPLFNDTLYKYTVRHYSDHLDWTFANVQSSSQLYRMTSLKPDTRYTMNMNVCCTVDDTSLWFAGDKCELTNKVSVQTFVLPDTLQVLATSDSIISLKWVSPSKDQVLSHFIKYKPKDGSSRYMTTQITDTEANSVYTIGLSGLDSDTEYEIALVLEYPYHSDYTLRSLTIRTNQSVPEAVLVESAACDEETCQIVITGADGDVVRVNISCSDEFQPLTLEVDPDGTKFIQRSRLPDDITACTVRAWSTNSVGSGPVSPSVSLTLTPEESPNGTLVIVLSVTATLLVVLGVAVICLCTWWKKRKNGKTSEVRYDANSGLVSLSLSDTNAHLGNLSSPPLPFSLTENSIYEGEGVMQFRELLADDKGHLKPYDREKLSLTKFLGSGAFGEVYAGKARNIVSPDTVTLVAVKTLRADASLSYKEEFVKEAKLMSQFDSEHIVRLLGVCIDRDPYYIVIELMNKGDLVAFLRKSRPNRERGGTLNLQKLISICIDVSAGCRYLEMLHFVHRDLAARNCLVNLAADESQHRVKLGDFGLARDIYRNDYYRKEGEALLPVRWMSPEALVDGVFTTQSDIWAFGVLMWEVFSFAMQPYPARSNIEVLKFVTNSGTLDKPIRCPQILFEMMYSCWNYNSADRPMFVEIHEKLNRFLTEEMTDEIIEQFNGSNRRLISENEFFSGSTSSGAGVSNAVMDSPVFESEISPGEDIKGVPQMQLYDEGEQEPTEFLTSLDQTRSHEGFITSIKKKLFSKKRPGHRLERVQSVPVEPSNRRTNKYVRSDSTISADRCKSIKTYTEQDGRQVSFEEGSFPNHGELAMNSISEEKLKGSSLQVDIAVATVPADRPPSPPASQTIQYSTMKFGDAETSNNNVAKEEAMAGEDNPVQYSSMRFGDSQTPPEPTVQYSTMAFAGSRDKADDTQADLSSESTDDGESEGQTAASVQYSTMNFNSMVANSHSEDNHMPEEVDSKPVQYSTMLFNQSNGDIPSIQQPVLTSTSDQSIQSAGAKVLTESTPFGAKVDYNSDRFRYHSPLSRRKRATDPNVVDIVPGPFIHTL